MTVVEVARDGEVAILRLSRPKKLNAISSDVERGSTPCASISSRIERKYDGVTMFTRGSKSRISWTCRGVMPPEIGMVRASSRTVTRAAIS